MKKFLVTYLAPASVVDEWKKTEPEKRKQDEEKMQGEWKSWMRDHAKLFSEAGDVTACGLAAMNPGDVTLTA